MGIDTLRLRFRLEPDAYRGLAASGTVHEGAGGERWRHLDGLDGVRVGAYPSGLVYAESRAAVMLDGPESTRLVRPAEIDVAVDRVAAQLQEAIGGEVRDAPVALGRVDVTGELQFEDGRDGLALLTAMSVLDVPWCKTGVEGRKAERIETVTYRSVNGRSIWARAYDKGRESGTHEPGERVRFERQIRLRKAREQTPAMFGERRMGDELLRLVRRFRETEAVTVCSPAQLADVLRDRVDRGLVTARLAESLAGYSIMRGHGLKRSSAYNRVAELRRLGIALDELADDARVVPLASYCDALEERWEAVA